MSADSSDLESTADRSDVVAIALRHLPRARPRQPFTQADKQAVHQAVLASAAPLVDPVILRSRWGKPELQDNAAYVSLSHSGPWLAGAAAHDRVGIDVEVERRIDGPRLANRLDWPAALPVADARQFFALWTLWEAAIKAHRRDCRALFARLAPRLQVLPQRTEPQHLIDDNWQLLYWSPAPGCHASVLARASVLVRPRAPAQVRASAPAQIRWT